MKQFRSITEAFDWWVKNIYPGLPAEKKKGRLTYAWRDYTHGLGISEKRMKEILSEHGQLEIRIIVTFKPD